MTQRRTTKPTESEIRDALRTLFAAQEGYSVDLFGLLTVTQLENLQYRVVSCDEHDQPLDDVLCDQQKQAIDLFLRLRRERRLGFQFEVAPAPADDALATVTLNETQQLYCICHGGGYSSLGFDRCLELAQGYAEWLTAEGVDHPTPPEPRERGTIPAYFRYKQLAQLCCDHYHATGARCPAELTPQLRGLEGMYVEVVDRWGEQRSFWVGRSAGAIPYHLEIEKRNGDGGPAVSGAPFKSVRVVQDKGKR